MAASEWILGFKRQADNDGLTDVKIVNDYLAQMPAAIRAKMPTRFMCEKAYRKCRFPNPQAKAKAYKHMCSRNSVIFGQGNMFEAANYKITQNKPGDDFSMPPEAHLANAMVWSQVGIFMFDINQPVQNIAHSADWNPAIDDKYWLAHVKMLEARELNPNG